MFKHKNTRTGTITMVDSKGKHHVIRPNEIVLMDKIYEGKGVICINKDAVKITKSEQDDERLEEEKPKIKRRRID